MKAYHNIDHVNTMLKALDEYNKTHPVEHYQELVQAITYHDEFPSETESAKYALKHIPEGVDGELVEKYILATDHTKPAEDDFNCRLIRDLDLLILGQSEAVYDDYSRRVRLEYPDVPENVYKAKRKEILEQILASGVYHIFTELKEQAEKNLRREICVLSSP